MKNLNQNTHHFMEKKWKKLLYYNEKLIDELKITEEVLKKNRIVRENWYKNKKDFTDKI